MAYKVPGECSEAYQNIKTGESTKYQVQSTRARTKRGKLAVSRERTERMRSRYGERKERA